MKDYTYHATIVRVHDGDTLTLMLDIAKVRKRKEDKDCGFRIYHRANGAEQHQVNVRLYGLNAAEITTDGGKAAAAHLKELLLEGTQVLAYTFKPGAGTEDDKYGRWLALVELEDGTVINTKLIEEEWAAGWDGHGVAPVPPWPRTV